MISFKYLPTFLLLLLVSVESNGQTSRTSATTVECERLLLKSSTRVAITPETNHSKDLEIRLVNSEKGTVSCGLSSKKNRKVIERWLVWKAQEIIPTVPELTAWLTHPWALLSRASARRLAIISKTEPSRIEDSTVEALITLARDEEVSLRVTTACVAILSHLRPALATTALTTVLERARQTGVKMSAARALAKIMTDGAKRALVACAQRKERTISLLCEKQRVLWAARQKAQRTP